MIRLFVVFLTLYVLSFSNGNVNFKRAVPDFTIVTEMTEVVDFDIDGNSRFYFLDSPLKSIMVYDANSNFINKISLESMRKSGCTFSFIGRIDLCLR